MRCLGNHSQTVGHTHNELDARFWVAIASWMNKLSTRALKEFRKTVGVVSQHPWNLFSAANYLREITTIKT